MIRALLEASLNDQGGEEAICWTRNAFLNTLKRKKTSVFHRSAPGYVRQRLKEDAVDTERVFLCTFTQPESKCTYCRDHST